MPKEVIYSDQLPWSEEDPGVAVVEVRWGRDTGHMQLVTKAIHRATGDRLSDDEGIHYTDGFYVDLNRSNINDLIRQLRRARDQAFGRDE